MVRAPAATRSKAMHTKPSQAVAPLPRSGFVHGGAELPFDQRLGKVGTGALVAEVSGSPPGGPVGIQVGLSGEGFANFVESNNP